LVPIWVSLSLADLVGRWRTSEIWFLILAVFSSVVTDAYQARTAEFSAQYLRYMAIAGDSGRLIADIAP
jgi:hypothetical protein